MLRGSTRPKNLGIHTRVWGPGLPPVGPRGEVPVGGLVLEALRKQNHRSVIYNTSTGKWLNCHAIAEVNHFENTE